MVNSGWLEYTVVNTHKYSHVLTKTVCLNSLIRLQVPSTIIALSDLPACWLHLKLLLGFY